MSNDFPPSYTATERRQRATLLARTTWQAVSDAVDPRLNDRIERIDARAADRGTREALALIRQYQQRADALATAKAVEKTARPGTETRTARETRKDAERRLKDAEKALRRAGISVD